MIKNMASEVKTDTAVYRAGLSKNQGPYLESWHGLRHIGVFAGVPPHMAIPPSHRIL